MTLTLLIIWALSPLVLIPSVIALAVINNKAAKKSANLQQTLYQLMQLGRITEEEYHYMSQGQYSCPGEYGQTPGAFQASSASQAKPSWQWKAWESDFKAAPSQPQPSQQETVEQPDYQTEPPQQPQTQSQPPQGEPAPQFQPQYQSQFQPAGHQTPYKPAAAGGFGSISPINGILIIGVLFIAIAAVIFATTTWQNLPDAARIIIILSGSALFFGTSVLAKEKLDLPQTGLAFYILGSLFLPISIVAVGYFKLFGYWFTLTGEGRFTVGFTAFLLLMAASAAGAKLYSRIQFLWVSLPCGAICISCLSLQIYEAYDLLILVLSLYSTGFLLGVRRVIREKLENREGPENKDIYTILENYAFMQIGICGIGILFVPVSGFIHFCAAVVFFILFLSPDANAGKFIKHGSGSYISSFFLIFSVFLLQPGRDWMLPSLMVGTVLLILLETSGLLTSEMKKPLGIACFISIAVTAVAGIWYHPGWSLWLLLSAALLLTAVTIAGLRGRTAFLRIQPLILVTLFFGITDLWIDWEYKELMMAGLCTVAFILYLFVCKDGKELIRTPFSDGIFFTFCFLANFSALYDETKLVILILSCILLSVITVRYKQAGYALPHLYLFSCYPLLSLAGLDVDIVAFAVYGIVCLLGILMAFKKEHPISGVMLAPITIFAGLYGVVFTALHYAATGTFFYDRLSLPGALFLWVGAIYFTVHFFRGIYFAQNKAVSFYIAGAALMVSMLLSGNDFIQVRGLLWGIFIPAAACCLLEPIIRTRRVRDNGFLSCHLPRLQAGGLNAAVLFCILTFSVPVAVPSDIVLKLLYSVLTCILCIAAFLSLFKREFSILTVIPTVGFLIFVNRLLHDWMMAADMADGLLLRHFIVFAVFSIAGRIAYSGVIETDLENMKLQAVRVDWPTIAAGIPAVLLISSDWNLSGWLLLALYCLLFYNRSSDTSNRGLWDPIALTMASAALVFACWSQLDRVPFEFVTLARLIPPFAALQFAYWWAWKKHPNAGHSIFGYSILSIVWLLAEALIFSYEAYALILGISSLGLIIFGYQRRSKRWFLLAAITLIVIGVYLSRSFWLSLGWWVYLLAAGTILIAFGAGNERAKRRGGGVKERAGKFWSEWH